MDQLKILHNGAQVRPTFSGRHLANNALDAVLFTSCHNINSYSDFLYRAFGLPYGLVATQEHVTSTSANIDRGQPWRRTFGDNLGYADWQRTTMCARCGNWRHGAAGSASSSTISPWSASRSSRTPLPEIRLVDIAAGWMRDRHHLAPRRADGQLDLGPVGGINTDGAHHAVTSRRIGPATS